MSRKLVGVGLGLTIANVSAGVLGYVFQVLMGRLLSVGDFALFAAIMSLNAIISSPIQAFATVLARNITKYVAFGSVKNLKKSYVMLSKGFFITSTIVLVSLWLCSGYLAEYLANSNRYHVFLLGIIVIVSAASLLNHAYLQGMQRYYWLAGTSVSSILFKLLLALGFVLLGMGCYGPLLAVSLSGLLVYLFSTKHLLSFMSGNVVDELDRLHRDKSIFDLGRLVPVIVATTSISLMTQIDMVVVNNYFPSELAGQYAAAATLGRAILYLPGGLVIALLPMVTDAQARNKNVFSYLLASTGSTLVLCGAAILFYWFFGDWIIERFYGPKYVLSSDLLKWYGLMMLPMALMMVAEYFAMALGKVVYAWLSLFYTPLQLLLISQYHSTLFEIMLIVGMCGLLLLLSGYFALWKHADSYGKTVNDSK